MPETATTVTEALVAARAAVTAASTALDAAKAQRDAIAERLREAARAVDDAKATRANLVARTAAGEAVKHAELRKADDTISAAEASHALLRDAVAIPSADIAKVEADLKNARAHEARLTYKAAIAHRIEAAEELDRLGAAYSQAAERYLATGAEVEAAFNGLPPGGYPMHHLARLRDKRLIRNPLSFKVQLAVVQTGSVVHGPIAADERIAFS